MSDKPEKPKKRLSGIRHVGKVIMLMGATGAGAALVWWLLFFHQMLGEDVKAASECFYRTTVECEIGNFVGLFMDTPPYEPALLWLSGAAFAIGLLVYALAPRN
ncbi:MAG: hypothetical protein OXR84_15135 [Magnetovibrio sp.]|nr:hypothetical protein [Magnetovibrio sp.]